MRLADRFNGEALIDELCRQKMVGGDRDLAATIAEKAAVLDVQPGEVIIEQADTSNDIYFILAGVFDVVVNRRPIASRGESEHVGEMAAIQPTQTRSATVIAREHSVVARLSEPDFTALAEKRPSMYRAIARELARRLMQRNAHVGVVHDKIRVFILSSIESLGVARTIQEAFDHDPFDVEIWTDGAFKVANYTIESLEAKVEQSDFAIAIAHADDVVATREDSWPAPRDNVIFELGLFMGRLGRKRAILMEPREEKVKLPSDFAGVETISYRYRAGRDAVALMGPACNRLRMHILELGPNNG